MFCDNPLPTCNYSESTLLQMLIHAELVLISLLVFYAEGVENLKRAFPFFHFPRGPSMFGIHFQLTVYMLAVLICSRTEVVKVVTLRIRADYM